jgi:hypothetical protein
MKSQTLPNRWLPVNNFHPSHLYFILPLAGAALSLATIFIVVTVAATKYVIF